MSPMQMMMAASGARLGPVNWSDMIGVSPVANAGQEITGGTAVLRATLSGVFVDVGPESFAIFVNGAQIDTEFSIAEGAFVEAAVQSGDTVFFFATKGLAGSGTIWTGTATVTAGAQVLDTFTIECEADIV